MSIRLPGLPLGVTADRICHGALVAPDEFELYGDTIHQGGRVGVSAVVVTPQEGWEFVQKADGHFEAKKK